MKKLSKATATLSVSVLGFASVSSALVGSTVLQGDVFIKEGYAIPPGNTNALYITAREGEEESKARIEIFN